MATIDQVKAYLAERGIDVLEFVEETATCETAARAVGCSPAEIAKTLLFLVGGQAVAVVTCGDMKVKSSPLKQACGLSGKVKLPQGDEVQAHTGYLPGGVCPFLLPPQLPVLLDRSMTRFPVVYAAAGNCHSAVPVTFEQLQRLTGGQAAEVCEAVC